MNRKRNGIPGRKGKCKILIAEGHVVRLNDSKVTVARLVRAKVWWQMRLEKICLYRALNEL